MTALRPSPWQWFLIAVAYYSFAITNGQFTLFAEIERGLTFNSMLDHLLDGRFDVDPDVITTEGFVRGGRTYAYFGIFPALLRAPLLPLGLLAIDVTVLCCALAAATAAYFKVASVAVIQRAVPATRANSVIFGAVVMAIVFGGPQIHFLKPSIYQESALWAAAIAAGYVFLVIRSLAGERTFSDRSIVWMALLAGLSLLTRVSIGLGLYLATGFLLIILAYRKTSSLAAGRAVAFLQTLFRREWRPSWAILLVFVVAAGVINYGRFGNPTTFADLRLNGEMQQQPIRLYRLVEHGELNPRRIGYALLYYFFPINLVRGSDGRLLFQDFQVRMVDPPELPPSSFLFSDPLLMLLVGTGVWWLFRFRRWGHIRTAEAVSVMAGFAAPPVVVCMAIYLAFRYRLDFYPLFDLMAFLGLYAFLLARTPSPSPGAHRFGRIIEYSALLQIAASHLLMLAYKVTPFGDPTDAIARQGVMNLYLQFFSHLF